MAEEEEVELIFSNEGDDEEQNVEELEDVFSQEKEDETFTFDEDEPNLVATFESHKDGVEALKRISDKVKKDFEKARESTEEYREQMAKDWDLFAGKIPEKDFPFENSARAHVPIMLENISRLSMRFFSEIFGDGDFMSVQSNGPDDLEETRILTTHGLWQFNEQIDDFYRQQERAIMAYLTWGDATIHSFYDHVRRENRHETLTPDQFYVPFVYTTTRIDYSDVPYVVKVLHMYRHDLQRMIGQWEHVDDLLEGRVPSWDDEPDSPQAESAADSSLISIESDSVAPYKILQYEGWVELPDHDRDRYCQVIIDVESGHVLRLAIHEEIDWRDRERYNTQQAEYEAYVQQLGAYEAAFAQTKDGVDQVREHLGQSTEIPSEQKIAMIQQAESEYSLMEPPMKPKWMTGDETSGPEELRKVPVHMFSHGVCIENMFGSLGLSFGRIQADFNRGANTALSQFVDAATLGNCWTFIATESFDQKGKADIEFKPGKINFLTGTGGDDINKMLKELKPEAANPQLINLVDKLYSYGQSSIQAPSVLSGEPGKSGETLGGINARIEQATKQLSVSAKKYSKVLNNVIRNNARLNAAFLPDNELVNMSDTASGQQKAYVVGRKMYDRNYRIRFTSDLRFSSMSQRIAEADELVQLPQAVPPLQGNIPYIYEATKRALIARGKHDMVQWLGPQPTPPDTTLGIPPPPPPPPPGPPGASGTPPPGAPTPDPGGGQ